MIVNERIVAYINSLDRGNSPICNTIEKEAIEDDVPIIRKEMGNLLKVLLGLKQPQSILEVGTAVGYSSILMSENMPEKCTITTIENYDKRIPVARNNFKRAGKENVITLIEGDALEVLKTLEGPYDFIFMDAAKAAPIAAHLKALDTEILPYDAIYEFICRYGEKDAVMCALSILNYKLYQGIARCRVVDMDPVQLLKAVKNPVELENMRKTHIKDGVAVTRFMHWAKTHAKEGYTEMQAADVLEGFRKEQEGYMYPSFETIAGYGPHGAIVHYDPTPETDVPLHAAGLLLLDSGAHYRQGTTDVTRTIALGPVTDEEKRMFTLVLKGHLALSAARFPHGATGENLDVLARMPLWEQGLDYNHGTGHGVGYILSVHEGPQSFRWHSLDGRRYPLEEGMVISNEPGYYEAGKFGIRHENLVLVRTGDKTEFGQFMYLEPLTMAPFDRDAIDVSLLTEGELAQLNDYHRQVYATVSPLLDAEEQAWLAEATAPLTR